ncbi:MAG: hypothetical protein KDK65_02340 [Chlamydiia bacterium]|nr:hypothetical protein [Chlamydiia bacterium]
MKHQIREQLQNWPQPFIRSYALKNILQKEGQAFHSAVKYALKEGALIRIQRGLYRIDERLINKFELAQELHGPSYISLESALSYHNWIPEAVQTTTSCCLKRSKEITTPLGLFSYSTAPLDGFYTGVERMKNGSIFLLATPWRALADLIHTQKRSWRNVHALSDDLRIEYEDLFTSDFRSLEELATCYQNGHVRKTLSTFLRQLGG